MAVDVAVRGEQWVGRRTILGATVVPLLMSRAPPAQALSSAANTAWEALGGGPADLYYPDEFVGAWQVVSELVDVEAPLGEEMLADPKAYQRAVADLNQPIEYEQRFIRGSTGKIIADRAYNVDALTTATLGGRKLIEEIEWDADEPNVMRIMIPTFPAIYSRVTRRFQEDHADEYRLDTSEVVEQVFPSRDELQPPKVKASRCLTKYKWRTAAMAGDGPAIVATQVVSDFVTTFDGPNSTARVLSAQGKPALVYTYKMRFTRSM